MAQTELRSGVCPKCGEALEIPAHLKQFSCVYCGARLSPADIQAPSAQMDSAREAAEYYKAHILEVITNHIGIDRQLTKQGYAPAIDAYAAANEKTFQCLSTACSTGALTVDEAAAWFLDQLEVRWGTKKSANSMRDTDKFVIAIFLIPMLRRLGLAHMEEYCVSFHRQWMKRYPKSPFMIGDFNDINNGFKKKFLGLCFITTAICQKENKPDDCAELTAFRQFRDGYLRSCADGPALIEEYYRVAPSIVWAIEQRPDRDSCYDAIRETWLAPCYADLQAGALSQCKERYTDMVRRLEREYLS